MRAGTRREVKTASCVWVGGWGGGRRWAFTPNHTVCGAGLFTLCQTVSLQFTFQPVFVRVDCLVSRVCSSERGLWLESGGGGVGGGYMPFKKREKHHIFEHRLLLTYRLSKPPPTTPEH